MAPLQYHNLEICTTSSIPSTSKYCNILITPENLRPFPKAAPRKTGRRGRQPDKTKVLTMTPDKETCYNESLTVTPTKEICNSDNDSHTKSNDKSKKTQLNDVIEREKLRTNSSQN